MISKNLNCDNTINSFKEDFYLLTSQIIVKIKNVLQNFNDYLLYCKGKKLSQSKKSILFIDDQIKSTITLLSDIQKDLSNKYFNTNTLIKIETDLRVAMQSVASIQHYLNWRSPVYSQALLPNFFNLSDQGTKRTLYERWGHKEINRIETQLLKIFGLSNEYFGCTVVSSGMAAFTLVESYLIRNILKPGDSILVFPYIYFESKDQLKSLKWIRTIEVEDYDYKNLIHIIENENIKIIFIDLLTNTIEQRMIDIMSLLDHYKNHENCPIFVFDGTMLPCALTSHIASFPKRECIFYMESCSKYLQFGLDMSIAGVLIYDVSLSSQFTTLRRNMGLILTEYSANLFPVYKQNQMMNRIFRIEFNACEIANDLSKEPEITRLYDIIHPSLDGHPDHLLAKKINRYGGCIIFKLKINVSDQVKKMKMLIDFIIKTAQNYKIPIADGLSFGFSFPRITLDVPYGVTTDQNSTKIALRLYVGAYSNLNKSIVELFKTSFKQHAITFVQEPTQNIVYNIPNKDKNSFTFEIEQIISAARDTDVNGERDAIMILLMFKCSLSINEIISLRWEQVNLDLGLLFLKKNSTEHDFSTNIYPLFNSELKALKKIRLSDPSSEYVFVSRKHTPLTAATSRRIVKNAFAKANISLNPNIISIYKKKYPEVGDNYTNH